MRLNYESCIVGKHSILVPYRPEHINTYHEWMKDPYLLEMTASEPLTLDEEIQMQHSWMKDDDKCTFIILCKALCIGIPPITNTTTSPNETNEEVERTGDEAALRDVDVIDEPEFITENIHAMIGDVNLFLCDPCDEASDDENNNSTNNCNTKATKRKDAELDIMIAIQEYRNKGVGSDVVQLIIHYAIKTLNISRFFVKIKDNNSTSLKLFQEKFHFTMVGYTKCFKEYELEYIVNNDEIEINNKMDILLNAIGEHYYEFRSSND